MEDIIQIWEDMDRIAIETNSVNLAHGYADFDPPKIILDALNEVTRNPSSPLVHQYSKKDGHPRLVNILAKISSSELGVPVDPDTNVLITAGAQHALYCAITNLIEPDDEMIIFEPFFSLYESVIKECKVKAVYVILEPRPVPNCKEFTFDRKELESKFNKKTKLFLLNNPNNPSGKVFKRDELEFIAELCIRHNVVVLSDEVYCRLIHAPNKHISIASLPGMWERAITIGSAGKCFSITGWKTGWCIGPANLIKVTGKKVSNMFYSYVTPMQEAVAIAFEREQDKENKDSYLNTASKDILERLKKVSAMLTSVGMVPIVPEAGYFLLADISNVEFSMDGSKLSRDIQFCMWLLTKYKISCLPLSAFLSRRDSKYGGNFVRFCCYKSDKTLDRAEKYFEAWKKSLVKN